jgi:hypothetical protein
MRTIGMAALVVAACAHHLPPVPSRGGPAWSELTSEHFVLWTDLPRDRAVRTLRHCESFYAVAVASLLGGAPAPPGRGLVIAFAEWDDWQAFGAGGTLGMFLPAAQSPFQTPFLAYVAGSHFDFGYAPDSGETVQHELGHLILERAVAWAPRFLHEGFASFLETAHLDERAGRAELGRLPEERRAWLRYHGDYSFDDLVSNAVVDGHIAEYYVRSHLFVAYLMNRQLERFTAYLRALRVPGIDPGVAWSANFSDLPRERIRDELADFVRNGKPQLVQVALPGGEVAFSERALSDADVLAVRSLMLLIIGGKDKKALAVESARAAAAADPGHILGNLMLIGLKLRAEVRGEAVVAAHPDDHRAWVVRAVSLDEGDEQRAAMARACALAPRDVVASPFTRHCEGVK